MPLRITIVTGHFLPVPPLSGGATERSWYGLAKKFVEAGHVVTFVSRTWPGLAERDRSEGINHIRVDGFDHTRHLAANIAHDFLWGIRVCKVLPSADIVICNTITMPMWLRLIKPKAGKVAVMIGRVPKGQVRFYRGVARIYAPSTSLESKIAFPWAVARTKVIGYPIKWGELAAAKAHVSPPVTIGYAGRLHPEKGIELLLRAACMMARRTDLPDWRIKLVGPVSVKEGGGGEDWFAAIRTECEPLLRDRVEWNGPEYDPNELATLYGKMDIFCYPSLAERGETFGVSVAEAMAAGSAVVVSALGCFADLVEDGSTGLIFDHTSSNSEILLYECLVTLMIKQEMRFKIADRGQEHARKFDYPEVANVILDDFSFLVRPGAKDSR